jgi:hypothetical protein
MKEHPYHLKERVAKNNAMDQTIALLERSPLCAQIVAFFLAHKSAMDTARGIAEWWIRQDLEMTQEALHYLVACGVVVVRTYAGINLYSLTKNVRIQTKLQTYFDGKNEV